MSSGAIASIVVFVLTYALILSGRFSQTLGALVGAVAMVVVGVSFGFYTPQAVASVIDVDTIWLLSGMMIIVGLLKRTGFFQFVAVKTAKWARGNLVTLFVGLTLASAVLSMFLDNLTTMLAFVPITLSIGEILDVSPLPFLVGETIGADLGGVFTLIGDPPNVVIGSAAGFSFNDFLTHTAPVALPALGATLAFLLLKWRKNFHTEALQVQALMKLEETKMLTDPKSMYKLLGLFSLVILFFFVHHLVHFTPGLVAMCGAALTILVLRPRIETILESLDWELLIFLLALFVVLGGLNRSGVLPFLAHQLGEFGRGSLLVLALSLFWGSGILTLFISAVPATMAFVPLVQELRVLGIPTNPLWWALALGIGFACPGTPFSHAANIMVINLSRHGARSITYKDWASVGIPVFLIAGLIGSFFLWLGIRTGWFM